MFVAVHLHVNEKNIYMRILQSDISFFYSRKQYQYENVKPKREIY